MSEEDLGLFGVQLLRTLKKLSHSSFYETTIVIILKKFPTYRASPKGNNYNFPLPVAIIRVDFYQSFIQSDEGLGRPARHAPPASAIRSGRRPSL